MQNLWKKLRLRERALAFATEEFRDRAIRDYLRRGGSPRLGTLALALVTIPKDNSTRFRRSIR